ncbi:adenosylcobinamide-GDP ribazoletransferase [Gloeocapsa sp. PCC 73106]|uniref:adenosylcobinamide-GDP ribazoletransferase n=1 Tax=Gloeocapsa sp. PCC 73106 TaxID=102232 RepID=UPI0002ABAD7E|nr:adenosylcobinamide-GDP ribazoletransferase [Gloeocapsa sp. PCC 73106]ELR96307.1 cobalamin-5'-phosphate synthase [Gloeocapsa sp. PCC 73106]
MKKCFFTKLIEGVKNTSQSFLGAIVFYTIIPVPSFWQLELTRIARWAPLIGLVMGGILLNLIDLILLQLQVAVLTRTAIILVAWIGITGGLHLDGAMDTADGLGVSDKTRRLEVMQDSRSGAFGVIVAILILLLKFTAMTELGDYRWLGLMGGPTWGRWAQVWAIARYPYLKPEGKGAFHKELIQLPQDLGIGIVCILSVSAIASLVEPEKWYIGIAMMLSGWLITLAGNFWFYLQFEGFTGDIYGAVVEWTEAIWLCLLIIITS